jgi:hypothetical protein
VYEWTDTVGSHRIQYRRRIVNLDSSVITHACCEKGQATVLPLLRARTRHVTVVAHNTSPFDYISPDARVPPSREGRSNPRQRRARDREPAQDCPFGDGCATSHVVPIVRPMATCPGALIVQVGRTVAGCTLDERDADRECSGLELLRHEGGTLTCRRAHTGCDECGIQEPRGSADRPQIWNIRARNTAPTSTCGVVLIRG